MGTRPRADAQPVRSARDARQIANRKSEIVNGLVRLPRIALGLPPWRGGILLLNHNRGNEGPGVSLHSRPAPFQQRTNTSCYLGEIPTHGFTVVLSVFGGTPPAKPLKCKICFALSGAALDRSRAHPAGDQPMLVLAKTVLSPDDITWMSLCSCSQIVHLSLLFVHHQSLRQNKEPCLRFSKQGERKLLRSSEPAYAEPIQLTFELLPDGCRG